MDVGEYLNRVQLIVNEASRKAKEDPKKAKDIKVEAFDKLDKMFDIPRHTD